MKSLAYCMMIASICGAAGCAAESADDERAPQHLATEPAQLAAEHPPESELPASGQLVQLAPGDTEAASRAEVGLGESASPLQTSDDPCGPDAKPVTGTTRTAGYGNTSLQTSGTVEFVSARSTMIVPAVPAPTRGTLFLWPGLQPLRSDGVIGYGVLQPVLTWGTSCAPGGTSRLSGWWISAQYVGWPPNSTRVTCKGGEVMSVDVGDKLDIDFTLQGTSWIQRVTNQRNGKSVTFSIDLKGQKQQWLLHEIEVPTSVKPTDDVVFTSVVAKLSAAQPSACVPRNKGTNDWFSPARVSADGKTCCISKIILRASGIRASSPNEP